MVPYKTAEIYSMLMSVQLEIKGKTVFKFTENVSYIVRIFQGIND